MHKHEVTIRPAKAEDALAIAALAHELARMEGQHSATTPHAVLSSGFSDSPACRYLVAEHDGLVVGMVMFYAGYDLVDAQCGLHLGDIIITQSYQHQGIGTRLMQHLAHIALSENYHWMSWTTKRSNKKAITFYTKLGAQPIDIQFMGIGGKGLKHLLASAQL